MIDALRRAAAVDVAKLIASLSQHGGRGGGTALPGLVAERVAPGLVRHLGQQIVRGTIVVTGTNGKTTTCRILGDIFVLAGLDPLRNRSGSNLMRGIASSLVEHATMRGDMPHVTNQIGLFEVDEAAVPDVIRALKPSTILLLDLFRDQLDRYGEVATVARVWSDALAELDPKAVIIANADDPLIAEVCERTIQRKVYFGLDRPESSLTVAEHASDVKACPRCGGRIRYRFITYGHLGSYWCLNCDFRRPELTVTAVDASSQGVDGSTFRLLAGEKDMEMSLPLPGLYNVYNAVASAATALSHDVSLGSIARALAEVRPAFGRMEHISVFDKEVVVALAKNPTGMNEVLRTLTQTDERYHLLMMLSDNIADGRDVSWIWDADVELVRGHILDVVFSGTRAEDMALRFKYADLLSEGIQWSVAHSAIDALDEALASVAPGEKLIIIPTYTAMLDVRNILSNRGHVPHYWE